MSLLPRPVRIRYRRPPDREHVFDQTLVHEDDDVLVSYLPHADVLSPTLAHGRPLILPASPIVWFTFPGKWHDIGRCHTPDGAFTGLYANVLTPVEVQGDEWSTTDLFLDVALIPGLPPMILDEDELDKARDEGWLDAGTGARAEEEARRLLAEAEAGRWPPPVVDEWPLSRVRAVEGVAP